jgi:multicomponent Na+:H+ antiporter subunit G
MSAHELASTGLLVAAALFFAAGTLGMLRFPDARSRVHALTKVDNLGLGLTAAALILQAGSWGDAGEVALVWLLALAGSAASGYLIAGASGDESR